MLHVVRKSFGKNFLRSATALSSSTRFSSLLIDDPKYGWLKDLELDSSNDGVFDGEWKRGQGPVRKSFDFCC